MSKRVSKPKTQNTTEPTAQTGPGETSGATTAAPQKRFVFNTPGSWKPLGVDVLQKLVAASYRARTARIVNEQLRTRSKSSFTMFAPDDTEYAALKAVLIDSKLFTENDFAGATTTLAIAK